MATGDILNFAVNADGRSAAVTIEGFTTGATYNYGNPVAASSLFDITVTTETFSSSGVLGTTTRHVYGVKTQRTPGTANPAEAVSGSDIIVQVALHEPIYNDDVIANVTISAAWATNTGGAAQTSTLYDNDGGTSNSTRDYPLPFGQWDVMPWDRVTANFRVAFMGRHKFGVAAVKFTATGATSAHSQTATVSTQTARQCAGSDLYVSAFETTIAIAGFTQGEKINLKAEVFPLVGDTEMDTDDNGANYVVASKGPIYLVCDKTGALRQFAVVNAGTGNDGTGVVSGTLATAEANKFATIKAAIDGNATCVYLEGSAHAFATRTVTKTTDQWIEVRPHPNEAGTVTVTIASSFPNPHCVRLKFLDVTIAATDANAFLYAPGLPGFYLAFERCAFADGVTLSSTHEQFDGLFYKDCTWTDGSDWKLTTYSTARIRQWFDGCLIPSAGGFGGSTWRVVGCVVSGISTDWLASAAEGNHPYNLLIEHNEFPANIGNIVLFSYAAQAGFSLWGNVIEGVTASVGPDALLSICAAAAFDIDHILVGQNTIVGERSLLFYNDTGSTAYYSRDLLCVGNIFTELDTKHDLFGTPDAARIGRWDANYGCGFRGNMSIQDNFDPEYPGYPWSLEGDPDFVDDQTGVAGGGDYTLGPASDALNLVPAGDAIIVVCDLYGTTWRNDGTDAAGAINYITTPTVTTATPASVTSTTASLGGEVTASGGRTVTESGVCYNTTGTPTTSDTKLAIASGVGPFDDIATGLTPGTLYYVRAYAINSVGTSYGSEETFTTAALGSSTTAWRRWWWWFHGL